MYNFLFYLIEKVVDFELLLVLICFYFKDLMDNFGVFFMVFGILKFRLFQGLLEFFKVGKVIKVWKLVRWIIMKNYGKNRVLVNILEMVFCCWCF